LSANGWYYDGQSSARNAVTVSLFPDRMEIRDIDDSQIIQRWSLEQLWWAHPPELGGAGRIALQGDNAARLELDDQEIIAAIRQAYPAIDKAGKDKGGRRRLALVIAASVTSIGVAVFLAAAILPGLLAPFIPASVEKSMGEAALKQVIDYVDAKHCTKGNALDALEKFRLKLISATDQNEPIQITVLNSKMINALAAPGGQIVVFKGFIDFAKNSEEFAAVVAHELGHIVHRHPTKGLIRHIGLTGTLDLLLAGSSQGILGTASGLLLRTAYSRDAEREADDAALDILKQAGIRSTGLVSTFKRFDKELPKMPEALKHFSTHPLSKERAARLSALVSDKGSPAMSAEDWQAIKEMGD